MMLIVQLMWKARHHGSPKWKFLIQYTINSSLQPIVWSTSLLQTNGLGHQYTANQ